MRKPIAMILAFASSLMLAACGGSSSGGSSSDIVSVSSISKCAHARPQTINTVTPMERMISQKTVKGGWLFQSGGDESEAQRAAGTPGFDLYVYPDAATAKEAFELFGISEHAEEEFGGGATYLAKNVVITSDQETSQLDLTADALLKRCVHSSATQSIHREDVGASEGTTSETPPTGEVGSPTEDGPSAGQSRLPGKE